MYVNSTEKLAKETPIQKFWNLSGRNIISDYEFLPSILNTFTVGTERYYSKYYNVNDAEGFIRSSIMIAVWFYDAFEETFADIENWEITESLYTYLYSYKLSRQKQLFLLL